MSLRLLNYDDYAERSGHSHKPGQLARLVVSDYERKRLRREVLERRLVTLAKWFIVGGMGTWLVWAVAR